MNMLVLEIENLLKYEFILFHMESKKRDWLCMFLIYFGCFSEFCVKEIRKLNFHGRLFAHKLEHISVYLVIKTDLFMSSE